MASVAERVAALEARMTANDQRTDDAETRLRELRGAEEEHRSIEDRLAVLERAGQNHVAAERGRRDRTWLIVIAILTGLVMPLIVTTVVTYLHLKALH